MANIQSNSGPNNAKNQSSATVSASKGDELKLGSAVFHDFLGKTPMTGNLRAPSEASLSASVSLGASSGGGGGGPISTTSDLRSDRYAGDHIEGVPCYGPRSDFMCPERPNVFVGMKRSNSHCYAATSADRFPAGRLDSLEGTELIKLLRNAGGDRLRRPSIEDSSSFPLHLPRPTSDSLISQPSSGLRTDANASKWDSFVPMNTGPVRQYPPRSSHVVPLGQLSLPNKLNESNAGQLVTQCAADEGSRTGIKGSGFLNSIKESGRIPDRNFSGILASSGKQNSSGNISEPESSLSNSQHGSTSAGCQMTIFYNGQAHVFDSVHPNKAHIIMALAGSNGESWSTTYSPKSTATARKSAAENHCSWRKNDGSFVTKPGVHTKSFNRVNSSLGFSTSEKTDVVPTGTHLEGIIENDSKNSSHRANDDVLADK